MASKLEKDESGTHGARRITRHRIKSALKTLERKTTTDRSVHAARKELKKARASLRLLRDALGDSTYKKENAALRDAARPLSEVRDGRVLLDALNSVVKHWGAPASALPLKKFQTVLDHRRVQLRDKALKPPAPLKETRETLRDVRRRSAQWQVGSHGWSVLGAGLKRTYSKGRHTFARVQVQRSNELLHEWRKQAKYLWHQLQIFEPLWPRPVGELSETAHKLADLLGDDHDLFVLCDRVTRSRELFPSTASHRTLVILIERYRAQLQEKALSLGKGLYKEKPGEFADRLGKHWHDWRRH